MSSPGAKQMIVYVGFAQPDEWEGWAGTYARHARRFESAAGDPALVVPFGMATPALIGRLRPRALVLSGFARSFECYDARAFDPVIAAIEACPDVPTLAICGSHQLLGYHGNGELVGAERVYDKPMRRRRAGEPITNPDYHPEFIMERGFYELQLHSEDPLFAACGRPVTVLESHYCEIKELPPGYQLLASTPECRIQAMRHETRPIVSVQFHPEDYSDAFPDGRHILESFFSAV